MNFKRFCYCSCWFVTVVVLVVRTAECQTPANNSPEQPNKEALIKTLKTVFPLLEKKDFSAASKHFNLPPNFKPEMLDGFIERQELSLEGIACLESEAKFGKLTEMFEEERAQHFAKRANVDIDACYGFNHQTKEVPDQHGEVIGFWNGTQFKLIRLDDVGKIAKPTVVESKTVDLAAIAASLPALKNAVEANPDDVAAKAQYASALIQLQNAPAAWRELREGYILEPNHAGIRKGLDSVWGWFESKGLHTAGLPIETIEGVMGKPDQVVDRVDGVRWVYAYFAIDFRKTGLYETIDLRGATEKLFAPTEIVSVGLDGRQWSVGNRIKRNGSARAHFYLAGESTMKWNERFEVERIVDGASIGTMKDIATLLVKQIRAKHPKAEFQMIEQEEAHLIVGIEVPLAGNEKRKQFQLVKMMKGPSDLHRVAYALKAEKLTVETQKTWLRIMQAAKLDPLKN